VVGARSRQRVAGLSAVLFDLDGTLTDPRAGIVRCLRHALAELGVPAPSDAILASFIGPPLRTAFAALLGTSDQALVARAMTVYRERFGAIGLHENQVYTGVPEMLHAVGRVTARMFVATAKPTVYAERILNQFGLAHHFAGVYGADLDGRFEDKADLLAHLLATERIAPGAAAMVADRGTDVTAGRRHGLHSIGILWGYGSRAELVAAGADWLCPAPGALVPYLAARAT
jgi:phosphoglycolate phosphatase